MQIKTRSHKFKITLVSKKNTPIVDRVNAQSARTSCVGILSAIVQQKTQMQEN